MNYHTCKTFYIHRNVPVVSPQSVFSAAAGCWTFRAVVESIHTPQLTLYADRDFRNNWTTAHIVANKIAASWYPGCKNIVVTAMLEGHK